MIFSANTNNFALRTKPVTKVMWHADCVSILSIGSYPSAAKRCHRVMGEEVSAEMM